MADAPPRVRIRLLGEFGCTIAEQSTNLPAIPRGMLAHIALENRSLPKRTLEHLLWPGLERAAAAKRLSQILWRVRDMTGDLLVQTADEAVALNPAVAIDWEDAQALARRLGTAEEDAAEVSAARSRWFPFTLRLLPDHDCAPVRAARFRWNHLRLLALHRLADTALRTGDAVTAVDLAASAVDVDELAEWPHLIIANAHLEGGNVGIGRRVLLDYVELLRTRCGLAPSGRVRERLRRLGTADGAGRPDARPGTERR